MGVPYMGVGWLAIIVKKNHTSPQLDSCYIELRPGSWDDLKMMAEPSTSWCLATLQVFFSVLKMGFAGVEIRGITAQLTYHVLGLGVIFGDATIDILPMIHSTLLQGLMKNRATIHLKRYTPMVEGGDAASFGEWLRPSSVGMM